MEESCDGFSSDGKETEEYYDDFTSDEEETEEYFGEKMQLPQEDIIQGGDCVDDLHVTPLPGTPTTSHSSTPNKFPGLSQPSGQMILPLKKTSSPKRLVGVTLSHGSSSKEIPSARHNVESGTQNNERSPNVPVIDQSSGKGPAPLPEQLIASQCKEPLKCPVLPRFRCSSPINPINLDFPRSNITQDGPSKNEGNKVKGSSYLHRQLTTNVCRNKELTFPSRAKSLQSGLSPQSQEEEDVYEEPNIPEGPFVIPNSKTLGANASYEDQDMSSQFRSVSISHTNQQGITQKQLRGHEFRQVLPQAPCAPVRTDHNKQPRIPTSLTDKSTCSNHKTLPKESQSYISLGDGESIKLTPLLQRILEKPYFHLISRLKARKLVMKGGNGTYLIRPSVQSDNALTITVKCNDRPYNVSIRQRPDTLFALGRERAEEETFSSIDEIVSLHCNKPIQLVNGVCVLLKSSPVRTSNVYIQHAVPGCGGNR